MFIKTVEGWTQYSRLAFTPLHLVTWGVLIDDKIYIKIESLFLQVLVSVNKMLDCYLVSH